jgi:putative ABC transport system permease protein
MRELLNRLIDWLRRDKLEQELADEMRFHRQQLERDALKSGASPNEVPYIAQRQLGSTMRVTEQARERWSWPTLDQLLQDFRYALRGLRRSPGFTATAVITLALGIGANAAMFGVVDQLMFRPYNYLKTPDRVHRVYLKSSYRGVESWGGGGAYTRYLDVKKWTNSFDLHAGFTQPMLALGSGEDAREFRVAGVSGTFFDFFDARPLHGRWFTPAEDTTPMGAAVAVLGYEYWVNVMGSRDVIGQTIQIGHMPLTTIIGVAPPGFAGVFDISPAAYVPITLYAGSNANQRDRNEYYTNYNWGWMTHMARRKQGVSVEQANADVAQAHVKSYVAERAFEPEMESPELARPGGVVGAVKIAGGPNASLEARTALWLTGVAAIVLLIACANVANLFLARALKRQREIAVRLALGVSRARLMTQTLTESLTLSIIGSIAGLFVAQWGGAAIRRMLVTQGSSVPVFTDWRTLAVVVGIALISGVLTGIAPAVLSGRGDLAATLKAGAREGTYHRSGTRVALLVAQGAMSVILLVGAALFVRSLSNVRGMRMGYDAEQVLLVSRIGRGIQLDSARATALRRELLARALAIPGVESAASTSSVPFWSTSSTDLFVPGVDSVRRLGQFTYNVTTPAFFSTFGTRIVRGRGITDADRAGASRVVVVSEGAARALWPNADAIGQCMKVRADTMPCSTVVGIAEDIVQRQDQMTMTTRFQYYLPAEQFGPNLGTYMLVKVRGDPEREMENIRKTLQAVVPSPSYLTVRPMLGFVNTARRSWQLGANLFVAFGFLALVVAGVGLYGVIAYNVNQRMHELGVRVALGAQRPDILRLVMGQGARFALAGTVVGIGTAWFTSRWLQPLLFRQNAKDPLIYGVVAAIMLAVALVACIAPAMRAAGADPNSALRSD